MFTWQCISTGEVVNPKKDYNSSGKTIELTNEKLLTNNGDGTALDEDGNEWIIITGTEGD